MRFAPVVLAATTLALVTACADSPTGAASPVMRREQGAQNGGPPVTVMTRNLYVGADVDAVIGALASPDPGDDFAALQAAIGTLQATDFPARARAIAAEIGAARPQLVALQEVFNIEIDLRALGMLVNLHLDFLSILRAELTKRGLAYAVAATVRTTRATPIPGIALTDCDVVLIDLRRARVAGPVIARQFAYNIGTVAPGVDIRRGYIALPVSVQGNDFTFVNTHLESGADAQIAQLRAAQAMELAALVGGAHRLILTGDLNDVPGSPMYQVLGGAGLSDTWTQGEGTGLTCCHASDLSNPLATFTQRIDYVWQKGFDHPQAGLLGSVSQIGDEAGDKIAGPYFPIWPSDHAGVVVRLVAPAAVGIR